MSRTIEVDFVPQAFERGQRKPRILMIDNRPRFTRAAKLALEKTGRYSVWEENEPSQGSPNSATRPARPHLLDIAIAGNGWRRSRRAELDPIPTLHRTSVVFLTALVTKKAEARSGLQIQGHPFPPFWKNTDQATL